MKLTTKSTSIKDINRQWHLIDVKGKILGRIATQIAGHLIGKSKSYYVPYLDCSDHVVVINSSQIAVTGKKKEQKIYRHYSGFPGGQKEKLYKDAIKNQRERIIRQAVSGMLPKNKLRDSMLRRLYIFPDDNHPYQSKFSQTS